MKMKKMLAFLLASAIVSTSVYQPSLAAENAEEQEILHESEDLDSGDKSDGEEITSDDKVEEKNQKTEEADQEKTEEKVDEKDSSDSENTDGEKSSADESNQSNSQSNEKKDSAQTEAENKTGSDTESNEETESEPDTKTEIESETETESESESEEESETETETETEEILSEMEDDLLLKQGEDLITGFVPLKKDTITTEYKLGLQRLLEDFPQKIGVYIDEAETETTLEVEWQCVDDYDESLGTYEFTPVIEEYELAEEVELPVITVEVEDESTVKVGGYIADDEFEVPVYNGRNDGIMVLKSSSLPSCYNSFEEGNLPEVRNQGANGACWTFASVGAAESYLIAKEDESTHIDLSELQLAYFSAHQYTDPMDCHNDDTTVYTGSSSDNYLSNGGNMSIATNLMSNKVGLVEEKYAPYENGKTYKVEEEYALSKDYVQLKGTYEISFAQPEKIKEAIEEYGGVAVSIVSNPQYYSATYNSYNNNDSYSQNHAVMLVGWDDDFPKENFLTNYRPSKDGAWLVRNSWGLDDYGLNGYFWISYEDLGLTKEKASTYDSATVFMVDKTVYDNCYAYDGIPVHNASASKVQNSSVKFSFHAKSHEKVKAVGVVVNSSGNELLVTVTNTTKDKSSSGTLYVTYAGYYLLSLPDELDVDTDDVIEVKVVNKGSNSFKLSLEASGATDYEKIRYTAVTTSDVGISGEGYTCDPRIKLFTNNAEPSETPTLKLFEKNDATYTEVDTITDYAGTTHQLVLKGEDNQEITSNVSWSVINNKYATVSEDGLVTIGSKKGTTVVKGTYDAGGGEKIELECTINVKPYMITYHLPTGDVLGTNVFAIMDELPEEYYPEDEANCKLLTLYKQGYDFDNWYKDEGLTQTVNSSSLVKLSGDLDLYPKWNEKELKIYYYKPNSTLTGYSSTSQLLKSIHISDMDYDLSPDETLEETLNGYAETYNSNMSNTPKLFEHWSLSSTEDNEISTLTPEKGFNMKKDTSGTGKYTQNTAIYLYPKYTTGTQVTVTYSANGGENPPSKTTDSVTLHYKYRTLPTVTRTGYTFAGWYTASDDGTQVTATTEVTNASAHTLYAHWTANTYTVTFNANGGVGNSTDTVTFGSNYTLPGTEPTRGGYTFAGWYTAAVGGEQVTNETVVATASNHTLYAHWTGLPFTVSFDLNGGNGDTPADVTVYAGNAYGTLPSASKADYEFAGWYTTATGGTRVTSSTKVTIVQDHTLYAHWSVPTPVDPTPTPPPTPEPPPVDWGEIESEDREGLSGFSGGLWAAVHDVDYTGNPITFPNINVYAGNKKLSLNVDYSLKYSNNTAVSTSKKKGTITITGLGAYKGKKGTSYFWIQPLELGDGTTNNENVVAPDIVVKTNGKSVKKGTTTVFYKVNGKSIQLKKGTDYTFSYTGGSYKAFGEYKIYIVGKGNFKGKAFFTETIIDSKSPEATNIGISIGKAKIDKIEKQYYTGNAITPSVENSVYYNGQKLNGIEAANYKGESRYDFVYSYSNNIKKGTGKVIFYGVNRFTGSKSISFSIGAYDVNSGSGFQVSGVEKYYDYVKGAVTPVPTVRFNSVQLANGTDYSISYSYNKKVGDAILKIKGKGNYSGTYEKYFTIKQKDIGSLKNIVVDEKKKIKTEAANVKYQNKANICKPKIGVYDVNGKKLVVGTDYEKVIVYKYQETTTVQNKVGKIYEPVTRSRGSMVEKVDIIPRGTKMVAILTGKNNYTGTLELEFTIQ